MELTVSDWPEPGYHAANEVMIFGGISNAMFRSKSKRASKKTQRGKKRWGRRIFIMFLLSVSAIAAVLVYSPAPVIEWVAKRALVAQGLTPASLRVEVADWQVFEVHDLALGPGPDLSIGTLRFEYVIGELVLGRIRKITLDDVQIVAKLLDEREGSSSTPPLSFGVFDQLISNIVMSTGPDAASQFELILRNGLLKVETFAGPMNLSFGMTRSVQNDIDASFQLQQETGDVAAGGLDLERLDGEWHKSASGVYQARFAISLRHLEAEGVEIKNAVINLNYEGGGADGHGVMSIHMPVLSMPKDQSRDNWGLLPDVVRDSLDAPVLAPFADRLGLAFGEMLDSAALNGRVLIASEGKEFTFTFEEPLVLAQTHSDAHVTSPSQFQQTGDQPSLLHVSMENADDQKPFLTLHPEGEDWGLKFSSRLGVRGGGLPDFAMQLLAQMGTPPAPSLPQPALAQILIDLEPWSEGGFTIGATGLELSIDGRADRFTGQMAGEIFLDGFPVAGLGIDQGRLGLAGNFVRDVNGFFYTQAADSCMILESDQVQIMELQFARPILSMCADEGEPLLQVLFGEGRPAEMQIDVVIPSEETQIVFESGLDVSGGFPNINLYAEYIPSTQQWRLTYGMYDGSLFLNSDVAVMQNFKLSGIASGTTETLEDLSATLDQMVLSDVFEFPRFAPIRFVGQLELNENEALFSALAADQGGRSMAQFEGSYDLLKSEGRLTGKTPPLSFLPAEFQPQDWLPMLKGVITDVEGASSADMSIQWGEEYLNSSAHIVLTEIKMATSIGPVAGINSEIVFSSLLPPATQKPQIIRIRSIDIGTELLFGLMSFSVTSEGRVFLEKAEWPWAGGMVGAERTELYFDDRAQELVLTAREIDLEEVFTMLDVDGLGGAGILDGELPVSILEGSIEITDGLLVSSSEGGTLQYNGSASQMNSEEDGVSLLFNALQDFHYDKLSVSINGRTTDVLTVSIGLNGYNPTVMDGFPIKLNINTEGPLVEMLRQGTIGYRIPNQIRERLDQSAH